MAITSNMIIVSAVATMILCVVTIVLYYHEFVPVHWLFFVAMAIGAAVMGWFHFNVIAMLENQKDAMSMVGLSRLVYMFILLSTSMINISAILYNRLMDKNTDVRH